MIDKDGLAWVVFLVTVGLIVAWVIFYAWSTVDAQSGCLSHGWPSSKVTWSGTRYCIKEISETEHVIPLRELEREHERDCHD